MPGAMRKLGLYLGLVEDDEDGRRYAHDGYDGDDHDEVDDLDDEPRGAVRRWSPDDRSGRTATLPRDARTRGATALDTALRAAPAPADADGYRITTVHPRTYNDARTIGEQFRDGTPVIMNLTEMDDGDAKRLVDFAAGLIFGLRGRIERITNKVFLLSPEHVEVTAEDKARIATGGFFNQS